MDESNADRVKVKLKSNTKLFGWELLYVRPVALIANSINEKLFFSPKLD